MRRTQGDNDGRRRAAEVVDLDLWAETMVVITAMKRLKPGSPKTGYKIEAVGSLCDVRYLREGSVVSEIRRKGEKARSPSGGTSGDHGPT